MPSVGNLNQGWDSQSVSRVRLVEDLCWTLRATEIAVVLGTSTDTTYALMQPGGPLLSITFGRARRVALADLLLYVDDMRRLDALEKAENAHRPRLLTVLDVGNRLHLSRAKIYDLLDTGELRSLKVGALRRISLGALRSYIDLCRNRARAVSDCHTFPGE